MNSLTDVLRKLTDQGALDSSGQFTLDLSQARSKLGRFRMAGAHRYLVAFLLSALQMGARHFYLKSRLGGLLLEWDGSPLEEDLHSSYRLWNSQYPGVVTLLLGMQTALAKYVSKAHWTCAPGHLWIFTRRGESWKSRPFRGRLTHQLQLWLTQSLVTRVWHHLRSISTQPERHWVREARLAGKQVDIRWNDQQVADEIEVSQNLAFLLPADAPGFQLPARFSRPPRESRPMPNLAGFAYFLARSRKPTTVHWHLHSLAFGDQKLPGFLPGLVLYLNSKDLDPDLSLTRLVDNEARQKALEKALARLLDLLEEQPDWAIPSFFDYRACPPLPASLQALFITRLLPVLAAGWPAEGADVVRTYLWRYLELSCEHLEDWQEWPLFPTWTRRGTLELLSCQQVRKHATRWGKVFLRKHRFQDMEPLPHNDMPHLIRIPPSSQQQVQRWLQVSLTEAPNSEDPIWYCLEGQEGFLRLTWRRGFRFIRGVEAAQRGEDKVWQACPPHYPPGLRVSLGSSAQHILDLYPELWAQEGGGPHLAEHTLPYLAMLAEVGGRYPQQLPPEPLRPWGFDELEQELLHQGAIVVTPGRFMPWQIKVLQDYFGTLQVVIQDRVYDPEMVDQVEIVWRRSRTVIRLTDDLLAPDHLVRGTLRVGLKAQAREVRAVLGFGPFEVEGESQDLRLVDILKQSPLFHQWLEQIGLAAEQMLMQRAETLPESPPREREATQRALWSLLVHQMQQESTWQILPLSSRPIFQSGDGAWRDLRYLEHLRVAGSLQLWSSQPDPPGQLDDCWLVPPLWKFLAERILSLLCQ